MFSSFILINFCLYLPHLYRSLFLHSSLSLSLSLFLFPKVSATHAAGYRSTAVSVVIGPRSKEKALKTAEGILKRSDHELHSCKNESVQSFFCRTRRLFAENGFKDFTKILVHVRQLTLL